MQIIKIRLFLYTGIFVLVMVPSLYFLLGETKSGETDRLWLLQILVPILAAASALREARRLSEAKLIVDNQIMYIQSMEYKNVFVSCFGILFDAKIIKFNQGGIQLKKVEFGNSYLTFEYGTETEIHTITLAQAENDKGRLEEIIKKFHYETGIIPIMRKERRDEYE